MTTVINTWHRDHANFSTLLDMLEAEVRLFNEAGNPDYELMLDIMYYMTHYPDVYHHPKEDLVFAKVAAMDPRADAAVHTLLEQHVVLKQSGAQLCEALQGAVDGVMQPRDRVGQSAATYIRFFRDHMSNEESTIIPLAHRLLSQADWDEIEAVAPAQQDPLFGSDAVGKRYEQLQRRLLAVSSA